MSKMFTLDQLSKDVKERNIGADRVRLVEKWSRSGLLRGLDGYKRESMAQLLENQAAQVLKEAAAISTGGGTMTSTGQLQGFTNVAFPIVRRVFGGLVANELVSVQPMTLPSGLVFYLDYTYGSYVGGDSDATNNVYAKGQSLYSNPAGRGIQSGSLAAGGMYDIAGDGYSRVHAVSATIATASIGAWTGASEAWTVGGIVASQTDFTGTNARMLQFDPQVEVDIANNVLDVQFLHVAVSDLTTGIAKGDFLAIDQIAYFGPTTGSVGSDVWGSTYQGGSGILNLRRLNKRGTFSGGVFTADPLNGTYIQMVLRLTNAATTAIITGAQASNLKFSAPVQDNLAVDSSSGGTLTVPSFESDFGSSPTPAIPEIDIKIESIAITATSRKLRARWSPELAQDLNAYHSIDAEVELTSILSEQIALEIDREILGDLLTQANGAIMYWSRAPGRFVNKLTGAPVQLANSLSIGPQFTGTVREWYETLIETIIDVANTIHRKTLRGAANFMVTGPDVCTILESSVLYKPKFSIDSEGQVGSPFTIGAEAVGTVSNRFTVYKDPYFPRNKILVGYKGGSYLETGFVYSPYVPLIVTPTIFAPEDFTPRRGVMTRYGKKMIRSDFYGVVNVLDMNII